MNKAAEIFSTGKYTCVLVKDDKLYISDKRGVAPLLEVIDSGEDFSGCYVADKIIGKAAAYLYCIIGAKKIYAEVISKDGLKLLSDNGADVEYSVLTQQIVNRRGTGRCPMDIAVGNVSTPEEAYNAIKAQLENLLKSE